MSEKLSPLEQAILESQLKNLTLEALLRPLSNHLTEQLQKANAAKIIPIDRGRRT
jgi:hypothetical protein